MDKRVIFAVAGSGKTANILDSLSEDSRALIITYTENNFKNLRGRIIDKFGFFPEKIKLFSYFTFLYSFCYKPFLLREVPSKGINWDTPPAFTMRLKRTDIRYYRDTSNRLYHNRIAKLLEIQNAHRSIVERLEKYFDSIFIDEVQDFAGHDFNFLKIISSASIDIKYVGDFYQHTFDTSRDGPTNRNLHKSYDNYLDLFSQMGLAIDTETLIKSYRCSPTVCSFITEKLGINIESHRTDETIIHVSCDEGESAKLMQDNSLVKLFFREHYKFGCYSRNWGECKGEDHYQDVCIVLNPTTLRKFESDGLSELNPQTKNKLYVACTRARGNIYFLPQKHLTKITV